ncbi:zinc-binding alcohol dehydrogenase family protein [Microbacterium sp.]|uniref:quinone oxidoreductase family protein n=1 Tax=Microbacterium sp. TaxID=51671 RepID=UPI0025D0DFD7|nr:zinc-binding alcohol dehydrogenase family protein [Microbacterium sp.]
MSTMNAALVTSFDEPPHYRPFAAPVPHGDEADVEMVAVGLHPRVRSGASGSHYTSTGVLPLVPGVDGVGRRADGALLYFVTDDDQQGTMAERAVIDPRRSIVLPEGTDAVAVAAAMNPAMSSWVALRRRVPLVPGQSVLVLGATGNAGTMAVQVARLLGAGRIVGAGRDRARLDALHGVGADKVVALTDDVEATRHRLARAASEVDVVLDYLWGPPTEHAIPALLRAREDRSRPLDWVQIGAVAGADIQLPSAALRSANLRLLGSGQGSVSPQGYLAELPSLVAAIGSGDIAVRTRTVALRDIEAAWAARDEPGVRTVVVP